MKKIVFVFTLITVTLLANAQFKKLLKNPFHKDSSGKYSIGSSLSNMSTDDIAGGLKEALNKGVESGTVKLSAVEG